MTHSFTGRFFRLVESNGARQLVEALASAPIDWRQLAHSYLRKQAPVACFARGGEDRGLGRR